MKDLILLLDAEEDVKEIWNYTADTWGVLQADQYVGQLSDAFENIASGHAVTRSAEHIRSGYRQIQVGRHVLFFLETLEEVEKVRVLQGRIDVGRLKAYKSW